MSADHATPAKQAAAGRVASVLDEDGLLIVALSAFAIVFLLSLKTQVVTDGWMALVSGRWIAQHGLPSHDALTVWAQGRRWVDQQWLAQVTFYGLWRAGGLKLVLFVHTLLVGSGLVGAALIARSRGATARSVTWIAIPVFLAYYVVASVVRPQSFAFPLFAATLWLVLADARQPTRRVFATFPLLVLWANLHGSVLLGAMLVSLCGLVGMLERRRASWHGIALLLGSWACVFASPYALHLPAYYRKFLVGNDLKQVVSEWAPTTPSVRTAAVYVLIFGGLWLLGRAGRRAPLLDQLAFVITAVLALEAVRNIAWIALVSLAVLPQLLDQFRPPVAGQQRLNRLLAVGVLWLLVLIFVGVAIKPTSWFTAELAPRAAAAASSAAGPGGRAFATNSVADWLLWERRELSGRVAFDSRFELLSSSQLRRIVRFEEHTGDWLRTARGYRVFVLDRRSDAALERALVRALRLRVAFSSPQVVVLQRRG